MMDGTAVANSGNAGGNGHYPAGHAGHAGPQAGDKHFATSAAAEQGTRERAIDAHDEEDARWTALPIGSLVTGAVLLAGFGVRQRLAAEPLILPSLLANRGFTAGLLLGLAFFAALNGLAYVISLFFQTALGLTPRAAAIALCPLMIGIIIASFVSRPLVVTLGRVLVIIGLVTTLAGAAGLWATVLAAGTAVSVGPRALDPGARGRMGTCISSIYDVAIGDVAPGEAAAPADP